MGGKGKKPKQKVTSYFMTVHYAICQGPVDVLSRIKINNKTAWIGLAGQAAKFLINNQGLFGGPKKEGGVLGTVYYQAGNFVQKVAAAVASKYGRTVDTMTGYRGIATAMFAEDDLGINASQTGFNRAGFYWSANQPFVPAVEFTVTRIFKDWQPGLATIVDDQNGSRSIYISIDDSGSMAGTKLASMKTAMLAVLDDVETAIGAGLVVNIAIQKWSNTFTVQTHNNADAADIDSLRTFINGFDATGGGTDFNQAALGAVAFFNAASNIEKRIWVFITDGEPAPAGSDDTAAITASDLLDQDSGSFSVEAGTAVDCYGINIGVDLGGGIVVSDTQYTEKLDNTAADGVPIVTGTNGSGLQAAVQTALFGGVPAQMNAAHILYELLTNTTWGMGSPTSSIDDTAWTAAAQTLFDEKFGLSMIWNEQIEIERFAQEVLDHIEANLFVDPATGQFVLKLIRDDYDEGTLEVLDESNSEVTNYTRRSPGEIINEINLTWTNPDNEQDEVLTIQDLGAVVAAGGQIISDSRNYYGVRNRTLAWTLCQRDIATVTAPLATAEIEVDRTAWDYVPGDVIKITTAEFGVTEEIHRIIKIDYGTNGDSRIKINTTQDIFSFERPEYDEPPASVFDDPAQDPTAIDDIIGMSLNYFLSIQLVVDPAGDEEYPDSYVAILAATDNTDAQDYELLGEQTDATGVTTQENLGTRAFLSRMETAEAWTIEATTTAGVFVNQSLGGLAPLAGGFLLIGDLGLGEEEFELALIMSFDGADYTIRRGILDTVPRVWPAGTQVRYFTNNIDFQDEDIRAFGDSLDYNLLMNTSLGQGLFGLSPVFNYDPQARMWLPTRPANVSVQGSLVSPVIAGALATVDCTWSNRNRLTEDAQPLSYTDLDVTPEVGQETLIEFYDESNPDVTYNTIVRPEGDTSYNIPIAEFSGTTYTLLKFRSQLGGLISFSGHERRVEINGGYGQGYGIDYGGDT